MHQNLSLTSVTEKKRVAERKKGVKEDLPSIKPSFSLSLFLSEILKPFPLNPPIGRSPTYIIYIHNIHVASGFHTHHVTSQRRLFSVISYLISCVVIVQVFSENKMMARVPSGSSILTSPAVSTKWEDAEKWLYGHHNYNSEGPNAKKPQANHRNQCASTTNQTQSSHAPNNP